MKNAASWFSKLKPPALGSPLVPFVAGLLLLSAGAYLAYPPAGLIAPGLVLLYVALAGEARGGEQ
jgi:hypothetical protein